MDCTRYLATPFVVGGRDVSGWDCWGCVQWIARAEFGYTLPDFPLCTARGDLDLRAVAYWMDAGRALFERVETPRPGDVVVLRPNRLPTHAGLMISAHEFIHCERPVGTHVADLRDRLWRGRAEGFYRHG